MHVSTFTCLIRFGRGDETRGVADGLGHSHDVLLIHHILWLRPSQISGKAFVFYNMTLDQDHNIHLSTCETYRRNTQPEFG